VQGESPLDARRGPCHAAVVAVVEGMVAFNVSTSHTAESFSQRVGVQPTTAKEVGDPVGNGRSGRRHTFALWRLEYDYDDDTPNPLNDALLDLLTKFDGREEALDELRDSFELGVQCHGTSNSPQGGFWLSPEVLRRMGRLGVDFMCTVYCDGDELDR